MNAPVLHILSVIEALPWLACCSAGAVPGQGGGRTVTHCIFLALCYNGRNQRLLHLQLCNRCMATSRHPDPGQPRDQLTGRARACAALRSPNICLGEKRAIHRAPRVSGLRCRGDGSVPPPLQNFANYFFYISPAGWKIAVNVSVRHARPLFEGPGGVFVGAASSEGVSARSLPHGNRRVWSPFGI